MLQLEIFRHEVKQNLPTEPDIELTDDFRPIQPLNHRNIYTSNINGRTQQLPPVSNPLNSGAVFNVSILYVLVLFLLVQFLSWNPDPRWHNSENNVVVFEVYSVRLYSNIILVDHLLFESTMTHKKVIDIHVMELMYMTVHLFCLPP